MQRDSPLEIKRQTLTKRYAELTQQFEAVNNQIDSSLSDFDKVVLENRSQTILKNLELVDRELKSLDDRTLDASQAKHLRQKLPQIDFRNQVGSLQQVMQGWGRQGGTGVFLIQDSHAYAGDLLIERLREDLKSQSSEFKSYPVSFASGIPLNEFGILTGLSRHLGLGDKESYKRSDIDDIVGEICKSLKTKCVVFIEIKEWHKLPAQHHVLQWIKSDLYPCFKRKFNQEVLSGKWRKSYVFLVISSDDELPSNCYDIYSCISEYAKSSDESMAQSERIFNIALEDWTEEDIEDWLEFVGLSDDEITRTAQRLFRQGRGFPRMIWDAIEKEFCC